MKFKSADDLVERIKKDGGYLLHFGGSGWGEFNDYMPHEPDNHILAMHNIEPKKGRVFDDGDCLEDSLGYVGRDRDPFEGAAQQLKVISTHLYGLELKDCSKFEGLVYGEVFKIVKKIKKSEPDFFGKVQYQKRFVKRNLHLNDLVENTNNNANAYFIVLCPQANVKKFNDRTGTGLGILMVIDSKLCFDTVNSIKNQPENFHKIIQGLFPVEEFPKSTPILKEVRPQGLIKILRSSEAIEWLKQGLDDFKNELYENARELKYNKDVVKYA